MYNKIFTKILDSSIWLAPNPTRLVWITLLAAMDEDGNAMFACAGNLAARARVTLQEAEAAIKTFESPDLSSGDPENEGRRIDRFPGGWHVLNAHKYRAIVTKAISREQTRARTEKWRKTKYGDASVTLSDETVTPSEAEAEADTEKTKSRKAAGSDFESKPVADLKSQIFASGVSLGLTRSVIGLGIKNSSEQDVLAAIVRMSIVKPAEPKSYFFGLLKTPEQRARAARMVIP